MGILSRKVKLQIELRKKYSPKKKKNPVWLYPNSQERQYSRILVRFTKHLKSLIKENLIPEIPLMIVEVGVYTPDRMDDYMSHLRQIIAYIQKKNNPFLQFTTAESILESQKINEFNKNQFQKITNSEFGIDIFQDEPWLQDQLKLFANQNAELISSLQEQELSRVAGIVERGLQQGQRFQSISKEIQKSFGITDRRAKLIARDQTAKLNASLTKLRQQELGVDEYEWQTSGDERVRPTHKANDGKIFKWSNPPSKTGHPGHDVNCRCVALPVLEGLLDIKMKNPA